MLIDYKPLFYKTLCQSIKRKKSILLNTYLQTSLQCITKGVVETGNESHLKPIHFILGFIAHNRELLEGENRKLNTLEISLL